MICTVSWGTRSRQRSWARASARLEGSAPQLWLLAIMDDEGRLLPSGECGRWCCEELVTPATTATRSERRGRQVRLASHRGHRLSCDEEGYLYIVDRKRDMIISGGFNVYPSEIEQVIWSHPAVGDCAVIGFLTIEWGEAVKAVIELKPGMNVSEQSYLRCAAKNSRRVKAPKTIEFWCELPRSSVGKVLKREIRARFWAGRERMV